MLKKETLNPEQWVTEHANYLYAFALRRLPDPELCKDWSAPYAEAHQFTVTEEDTKDRDETKIAGAMLHQTAEKIKDIATGNNES